MGENNEARESWGSALSAKSTRAVTNCEDLIDGKPHAWKHTIDVTNYNGLLVLISTGVTRGVASTWGAHSLLSCGKSSKRRKSLHLECFQNLWEFVFEQIWASFAYPSWKRWSRTKKWRDFMKRLSSRPSPLTLWLCRLIQCPVHTSPPSSSFQRYPPEVSGGVAHPRPHWGELRCALRMTCHTGGAADLLCSQLCRMKVEFSILAKTGPNT